MSDDRDLKHLLASPYDSGDEAKASSSARLLRWLAPLLAVVAPVTETVAFSPVAMYEIDGRTYVSVGVAVRGDVDPLSGPFPSVARWELSSPGGQHDMVGQAVDGGSPAFLQVAFDGVVDPVGAVLSAHLLTSESSSEVMLDDDAPQEQVIDVPFEVDVDGAPIVIGRLNYNDDRGYVSWDSPGPWSVVRGPWSVFRRPSSLRSTLAP